jgi:hypothetical protein
MNNNKEPGFETKAFDYLVGCAQVIGTIIGIIALVVSFIGLAWAVRNQDAAIQVVRAVSGGPTSTPMIITLPTGTPLPTYTAYPTYTPISALPRLTYTPVPINKPAPTSDPRLFWDDFQTGIKPEWKIISGRCNMVDGMLKCPVVPARFEAGSNDWTDYRLEIDTGEYWKFHEGVIIMVKLASDGSNLSLHLPPCGTAFWTYTNSNGKEENVAVTKGGACERGPFHVIIECNGNIYTTMMNGKVISTFQETRAQKGRIGFYTDIDNSEIWFDNLSVSIVK